MEAELTTAHDFALAFATEEEVKEEAITLDLAEEELEFVLVSWRRWRCVSMAELGQAKLHTVSLLDTA